MELRTRWWKPASEMDAYFRLLEENFQAHYGSASINQLAGIAKEKMHGLPEAVEGWPVETLHIILGELVFFSEPEILDCTQIASASLVCSNKSYVDLIQFLHDRGDTQTVPPDLIEHTPNHIIRVIDTTICKRASFCPDHPDSHIIWQAPANRRKSR